MVRQSLTSRDRVANVNRSAGTVRRIHVAGSNHCQADAVTCMWARPMRLERVQPGRVGGLRRWPLRLFMAPATAKIDGPRRVVDIGGAPVVGKITCRQENDNDVGGNRGYRQSFTGFFPVTSSACVGRTLLGFVAGD